VNTSDYIYTNSANDGADQTAEEPKYPSDTSVSRRQKFDQEQIRLKAQEYGRLASEKIEQNRVPAARAIDRAAAALESRTRQWPTAHRAAERLHGVAGYVRDNDMETMKSDATRAVKGSPGRSLMIAAVAGFVLGRIFRRG
jgi:ribosomal protein L16/L10AE